jgi:O-methyltransferase
MIARFAHFINGPLLITDRRFVSSPKIFVMTSTHFLNYMIYGLGFLLILLGIRYFWLSIVQRLHHPEQWIHLRQKGEIPEQVLRLEKNYRDKVRLYNFWFQVRRVRQEGVRGDFAELGVYRGDSALLIHNLAPERKLHLFDTFSGFFEPDISMETGEAATYNWHNFADTDAEMVREKLGSSKGVIFHEGHFPETTIGNEHLTFSLVHIDADLYLPVKAGLEYFYPRLSPGGVIIIHDYTHKWEGLCRAVDQFVKEIPENLIHVPDMHGSVMIIKNK